MLLSGNRVNFTSPDNVKIAKAIYNVVAETPLEEKIGFDGTGVMTGNETKLVALLSLKL